MLSNLRRGSNLYYAYRLAFTCWVPVILCLAANIFLRSALPYPFGWVTVMVVWCIIGTMLWEAWWDWRSLHRNSFDIADKTAAMQNEGERGFVIVNMPRNLPPRLIWAVIVHDHSSRIYMGWRLWSRKDPEFPKATERGLRQRQVA